MKQMRNSKKNLIAISEERKALGKYRRKREDMLKSIIKKRAETVDFIHLAQNRYQWRSYINKVTNLQEPG
jgi:hypothetical protein